MKEVAKYQGIDLFSGAGGLSLGAAWAGIHTVHAVEFDKSAAETYKRNHPDSHVINSDITKISKEDIFIEDPFIVFGGPPCQGFSSSNRKTRTLENPKNALYIHFLRIVNELNPKWIVFENVPGIASFQKGSVIKKLVEELEKKNYTISSKIVDATDYGVPQYRKRFILVANRLNIDFQFPDSQTEKITVQEAIGDLPALKNGDKFERLEYNKEYISKYIQSMRKGSSFSYQNYVSRNKDYVVERYNYIKQGENWSAIPEHLMKNYADRNKCHSGIYRRLKYSEPSVVISNYRKNMLIHPIENRGLSVREAARLQSFPDCYRFYGTTIEIQQQIGNAVPPLLAEAIFKRIVEYSE